LFDVAHVTVHVLAIRLEVDDRVSDDLPRAVIRDVAAASRLEDVDAQRFQMIVRGDDIRAAPVALDAQRDDARMLQEDPQVRPPGPAGLFGERALHRERVGVGNDAEAPDFKWTHYTSLGSKFSSCFLMSAMNASAVAPSISR